MCGIIFSNVLSCALHILRSMLMEKMRQSLDGAVSSLPGLRKQMMFAEFIFVDNLWISLLKNYTRLLIKELPDPFIKL